MRSAWSPAGAEGGILPHPSGEELQVRIEHPHIRPVAVASGYEAVILEAISLNGNNNYRDGDTPDRDWKKESNIDGMRMGLPKQPWAVIFLRHGIRHGA